MIFFNKKPTIEQQAIQLIYTNLLPLLEGDRDNLKKVVEITNHNSILKTINDLMGLNYN